MNKLVAYSVVGILAGIGVSGVSYIKSGLPPYGGVGRVYNPGSSRTARE
jgi:hypothetical protein